MLTVISIQTSYVLNLTKKYIYYTANQNNILHLQKNINQHLI